MNIDSTKSNAAQAEVPHVENIKYKGFNPIDKRRTIKNINILVDNFNKNGLNSFHEKFEYLSVDHNKKLEAVIEKSFPIHRNYLMKYIVEATERFFESYIRILLDYKNEFLRCLKILSNSSNNTLKSIDNEISEWNKELQKKDHLKGKEDFLKSFSEEEVDKFTEIIKNSLVPKQKSKIAELKQKNSKWIEDLENKLPKVYASDKKKKLKAENLLISLKKLEEILAGGKGSFEKEEAEPLVECFSGIRTWCRDKSGDGRGYTDDEIKQMECLPFENKNPLTNRIVLSLLGTITDDGLPPDKIISNYIDSK